MESLAKAGGKPLFTRRALYSLIWPLLVEQILSVIVGMIDVLMVAAVGETAVAGVSLVDSINILIVNIMFALAAGGTVVCSRAIGAGDRQGSGRVTAQLLRVTVIFSAAIMAVLLITGRGFLEFLFRGSEDRVLNNAAIYLRITVCSYPFLAIYSSIAAIYRAEGNTRVSMVWSLIINLINIAGNALCVFVLKMGVEGVAIPTLIARVIGAAGIMVQLQKSKSAGRIGSVSDLRGDRAIIRSILSIGVPNGIENGQFHFGKLILVSLVAGLGTASTAAYAVAGNLVNFLYLPGNTLGAVLLTVVGRCVGCGEWRQAKKYTVQLQIVNYAMLIVVAGVMGIFRTPIVAMYDLSAEAAEWAAGLLLSHCIAMIIWPIAFITPYYFRAIGRARFTMIVSTPVMWIFRVGLAYLFVRVMGMNVLFVWYAMFIDWIARVTIYVPAFIRQGKVPG